ncbi:MAG: hypothetical protein NUW13_02255 [candidate division KSB1 bacterium]|jgi:hypothetical protein|nr:hypothetical protein [candidate division KSB1 bacterium]
MVVAAMALVASGVARADIPAAFADVGYGARPMGMGGAYVALASDPYALFWNPACLTAVQGWQVSTMYARQFGLVPYAIAAAAKGAGHGTGVGAGFLTSGDEMLRESAVYLSYARRLDFMGKAGAALSAGLTAKVRWSSFGNNAGGGEQRIQGTAAGYGLDFGLRWKPAGRWAVGLLLRDFLNSLHYENETRRTSYGEAVPAALIVGAAFLARPNVVLALDVDKSFYADLKDRISVGGEWLLFRMLYLRAGWSQNLDPVTNGKANCGFGIQFFWESFGARFDFAYQLHFLAPTPRVSVSLWF